MPFPDIKGNQKAHWYKQPWFWVLICTAITFILYLSTVQRHINGSNHPYATDVGEIQNALPRWGTIHHSSYPLYSAVGSLFVTLLRPLGVPPALGASLFSAVFGAITIGLIVLLSLEIGFSILPAILGGLTVAVSTSIWVDASLAEVHTVTLALSVASLIFAFRFGRTATRKDLLLLTFFFTQAIAHQRSAVLLAPSILIIIWTNWRQIWQNIVWVIAVSLLAPLTYLYLPLRAWMGADWIFGSPDTWDGFWTLFFDNRAGRVFELENNWSAWWVRLDTSVKILTDDLSWPLLLLGLLSLIGMAVKKGTRRAGLAFLLIWILNFILTILIWEDSISDALLAAKLPVLIVTGLGIAFLLEQLRLRWPSISLALSAVLFGLLLLWGWQTRPFVLAITLDRSVESIIETVDRVRPFEGERRTTIITPWGRDFWGLTYAQAYRGQLSGLNLVDHNASHKAILARGDHLLAPLANFLVFPLTWWEASVGQKLYLSTAAPEIVEMSLTLPYAAEDIPLTIDADLNNGIRIRNVQKNKIDDNQIQLTIYWENVASTTHDFSVAIHLVAQDPPMSAADILSQADNNHPVEGFYPTTRWQPGEIVRDDYLVTIPPGSEPAAIRIGMYYQDPEAGFINTPWHSLPLEN